MKLGFLPVHLSERGTTTAVFDYAWANERLLGNQSLVLYERDHPWTFPGYVERFEAEFSCRSFGAFPEIEAIVQEEELDALYVIKSGVPDGLLVPSCPTLVHAVFENGPHGDRYAFVSRWLSEKYGGKHGYVPHMIDLPWHVSGDLRDTLGIPRSAIVFGGYGGKHSFNLPFVHRTIERAVRELPHVYFLFMNFDPANTLQHPRIIYLPPTIDREAKVRFIRTCDAMIHARDVGETFGLAVGEFSTDNKPVITFRTDDPAYDKEHLRVLGNRGLYYTDAASLLQILRRFTPAPEKDWNCYRDFTPERVMEQFERVFLDTVTCTSHGRKWTVFQGDGISRELLSGRPWEPHVTACLQALLQPGDMAIDIGANIGCHTVEMASCVGPTGRVWAFEPQPLIFRRLVRNVTQNACTNVVSLPFAIDAENRTIALTRIDWLSSEQNMGDTFLTSEGTAGQSIRLDDLALPPVRLIKLDVQGCEIRSLQGMRRTLERCRPFLLVEVEDYCLRRFGASAAELLSFLRSLRYEIFFLDYPYPSDHLCVPSERLAGFTEEFGPLISAHAESNPVNDNVTHGVCQKISFPRLAASLG